MLRRRAKVRGKVVLITGGARGIGRATAEAFLARGARVAIADIDEVGVVRTSEELSDRGEVRGYVLDVTDPDAFVETVGRVERELGALDILVNNAGIMPIGAFLDHTPQIDQRQIDINVHGVIHGMRAALPGMVGRNRGHVVNIASLAGRIGTPHIAVYSAAKHAVIGLTEAVRNEHRESDVHFSYVCPVLVQTDLISGTGRPVWPPPLTPEDVANAVLRAVEKRKVEVYAPRIGRLAPILQAIVPRRIYEAIGQALAVDQMFAEVDEHGREAYRRRILNE